jgi:hypothetical protein
MEESTWADSMDSMCEGGAECACSDRTDAHVEHPSDGTCTRTLRFAHLSFVRISCTNLAVCVNPMAVK